MKVFGAGFGRTGTMSLKEALDQLGFGPCYHMFEVAEHPERVRHWHDAALGRRMDWDEVFAGYQSAVDWPAAAFWRELVDYYPDAKVVLTIRDAEGWYDSAAQTIFRGPMRAESPPGLVGLRVLQFISPMFGAFTRMTDAAVIQRVFGGRLRDRANAIRAFEQHIADVRAEVPAERLLVYHVKQGWGPLCEFLGVDVPDTPFPRSNGAKEYQRDERRRLARMMTYSFRRGTREPAKV